MTDLPGSCFCGAVKYKLTAAPMFVHACWCRDCQKQTGGPFAVNALIEAAHVEILDGPPVPTEMLTDSGRPHLIHRCPSCRTAVWSDYGGRETVLFVRVMTLDEPSRTPPDVHIYTRSKPEFVDPPAGARVFEAYYDPKQEWPDEAKARWRAAVKGDTSRG
jgi:hypothetical protein